MASSMCSAPERFFLQGVYAVEQNETLVAMTHFDRALRSDREFYDAAFMGAAMRLCMRRSDEARQELLSILANRPEYYGAFIYRFLPRFRLMFLICYGHYQHIRPMSTDIATLLAVLGLREGRLQEAKKLSQQAVNADPSNRLARLVLAQVLFTDRRYEQALRILDKPLPDYNSAIDAISMSLSGKCSLALGDIRTGLLQMEAPLSFPYGKDQRLLDTLRIEAAREYERREFLLDAMDNLKETDDQFRLYADNETVEVAWCRLFRRVESFRVSGIQKPLRLLSQKRRRSMRAEYWEVNPGGQERGA